ncbi:MAG: cyclic nucleotide-binding domain-containing protein [Myxococcales bacterium]|nr:cyclic nucleotide-binding domain-containing protein [Myxococcales bacterium]MCB9531260.1 cyclic nucleotide-binding domain-containing protein [Myxococcales bacterium]
MLNLAVNTFFREIPVFANLDRAELAELVRATTPFTLQAGERLFGQGDPSDGMYIVEAGELAVLATRDDAGDRVVLAELGPGAFIGELSLIDGSPRSATVETISMTSGYVLTRAAFDRLREDGSLAAHKVVLQLARTLEQRKRVTEQRLRALLESSGIGPALESRELRELFGRLLKG